MPLTSHNTSSSDIQPPLGLPVAAPVLEYVCLFTHDLKRKQKRWQDGRLKFHTFNKRIMVYDERGNFIGDIHWREEFDFGEGEEFNLERGAVIVQVAECVGSKDQDLTELLDKRAREVEQRYARSSAAAANSPRLAVRPSVVSQNHPQAQFRQRHLINVANTPCGSQDRRAVMPTISPCEERIAVQQLSSSQDESPRPTKRRRRDDSPPSKSGYAQNLFGATLNLSSWSASAPVRHQPTQAPGNAFPLLETTPKSLVPSGNAKSSWPRPSVILDLTDDALLPVDKSKPSAATDKRECIGNTAEAPPKQNPLAPTPFKGPGMGMLSSKTTQKESQILTESEETLAANGQQPRDHTANPRNIAAKRNARKLHDTAQESVLHHSGTRPSNEVLFGSAIHRVSADKESPELRSGIVKDTVTSALPPVADDPLLRVTRNIVPEEPKAKLRIKARKKRGLLMIANNATARTLERPLDSPGTGIEASLAEKQLMTVDTLQIVGQSAKPIFPVGILPHSARGSVEVDTSQCEPKRVYDGEHTQSRSDSAIEATVQLEPRVVGRDDSQSSGDPVQSRVKLRERKRQPSSGSHRELDMTATQSGPRLASLGRRSVRSKEIIGSFNQRQSRAADESPSAAPAPRKEPIMSSKSDSGGSLTMETEAAKEAETRPKKATHLTNPATRGCKAAKESDAAGFVPQPVLTVISDLTRNDGRRGSRLEATLDSTAVDSEGGTARRFSRVLRASGGPWSKEAYDLLGCTRPG